MGVGVGGLRDPKMPADYFPSLLILLLYSIWLMSLYALEHAGQGNYTHHYVSVLLISRGMVGVEWRWSMRQMKAYLLLIPSHTTFHPDRDLQLIKSHSGRDASIA